MINSLKVFEHGGSVIKMAGVVCFYFLGVGSRKEMRYMLDGEDTEQVLRSGISSENGGT